MSVELNQVTAVVLAGGYGTRVQHLLPGVPKPMAPIAGRPFLEWVVRYLGKQGVRRVILATGHLADVVEKHFREHPVSEVAVECVAESSPMGTGGGLLNVVRAQAQAPTAWLVLNGDSLIFADLPAAAAILADPEVAGVIVGRFVPDASRYGTLAIGAAGEIQRFEEKRPGGGVINGGVYLLRQSLLAQFPDGRPLSLEKDVFPELLARGIRLKAAVSDAPFLDIGTPETLPQAEGFIRNNMDCFLAG